MRDFQRDKKFLSSGFCFVLKIFIVKTRKKHAFFVNVIKETCCAYGTL